MDEPAPSRAAAAGPSGPERAAGYYRRLREVAPFAGLSAVYAAGLAALRPFHDIPLNDDWAFAYSVRNLLETGHLRLSDWGVPNLVVQTVWGAGFAWLLGPGYGALRLSTMVLSWLGGAALYWLLRRSGADRWTAAAGTALLWANPLWFVLTPSFMTDVPAASLSLLALALTWRGLAEESGDLRWVVAGSFVAALAYGVRQTAVLLPLGICLGLLQRRQRPSTRVLAAVWALPLAAVAVHQAWYHGVHGPTVGYYQYMRDVQAELASPGRLLPLMARRSCGAMIYLGVFLLPVSLASWAGPPLEGGTPQPRLRAVGIVSAAALTGLWVGGWPQMPAVSNYIGAPGLGCFNIVGASARGLLLLDRPLFWNCLGLAGWASWTRVLVVNAWGGGGADVVGGLPWLAAAA